MLGAILVAIAIIVRARRPGGALEVAGEGPALGARPALGEGVKLAFFTAEGRRLCSALLPQAEPRLSGNVAIEVRLADGEPRVLAGFENQGGRTQLGEGEQPLRRPSTSP